ncbi:MULTISPECIES: trigger factor [unclassified Frankia]|uniref:trigger factor n=1 Tax=unclassified Frankia TaxID=2632575 RepID=UPI002AD1E771|nr:MULTISPECIES: trigger factor [unclassified Frankia]
MKATKETLSPTRVKLTVEVPFDELKPSVDAAYRKLAREVRVSGFRPGKVPPRILDQRLGRGVILEEAIQNALPRFYTDAVQQEEVDVLSRPEVDISSFADGAPLVFTAEVDVRPDISLPDYHGLEVTVDAVEVTDEQVDELLTTMRERSAVLKPVERPVQAGDFISLDLSATVAGEVIDDAEAAGMSYEVGSESLIDGLDAAITGAGEGESRTFATELLAGELAGSVAEVTVTVRGVKERELPELDDDFATTASEFDSLAELIADIRGRLVREAEIGQLGQARERVLDVLIERVDAPLPDSVLDDEVAAREHRFAHELERMGVDRAAYLETLGQTDEEHLADVRQLAAKALKSQFILDAVINAEQLRIDQGELMEQVISRAQRMGVSPDVFAQQLTQGDGLSAIMADTLRNKALTFLLRQATVLDPAGSEVELALPAPWVPGASAAEDAAVVEDDLDDDLDKDLDDDLDDDVDDDADGDLDAPGGISAEKAGGSTDPAPSA